MKHNPLSPRACLLIVIAFLFGAAGHGIAGTSQIVAESPDGKFGFKEFEDGRVDLVALPSRKTILKLGAFGQIVVRWAPDSRRFAAYESQFDGTELVVTTVYERAEATFRKLKMPELTLAATNWPGKKGRKAVEGGEFILADRWVNANTLVLKRDCQCKIHGAEEDKDWAIAHEITVAFDTGRPPVVKKKEAVEPEPQ